MTLLKKMQMEKNHI